MKIKGMYRILSTILCPILIFIIKYLFTYK